MAYIFEDYTLDADAFQLRRGSDVVAVEPQVFDLLLFLARNAGRAVTRDELLDAVWKGRIVSDATLSSRIKAARRAIGDDGSVQRLIRTVHGRGFVFAAAVEPDAGPGPQPVARTFAASHQQIRDGTSPSALSAAMMKRPAIAVLPFLDHDSPSGQSPFGAGVTEEIIAALSSWRWFPVIARNTVARYFGTHKPARTIGAETGARYLLGGSIRRDGARIRLSAALTDAETEREIWSGSFRREADDLFDVEEDLAREVAAAAGAPLGDAEMGRIAMKRPADLDAWEMALQANWLVNQNTAESLDRAEDLASRAAALDPGWSHPYGLVALARFQKAMRSWPGSDPETAFLATHEAASAALRIDSGSWLAHALCGVGELWSFANHDRALAHLHRAIEINPSANWSYHFFGCIAGFSGDLDEARNAQPRVFRVDPLYSYGAVVEADLALWWLLAGEPDRATAHIESCLRRDPGYGRGLHRAVAIAALSGDRGKARRMMEAHDGRGAAFDPHYIRASYPFLDPAHREIFFEGLRRAGINI